MREYYLHVDSKRKADDLEINNSKSRKVDQKCVDLIVLGIPWKSTEEEVKRYFEKYGKLVMCEVIETLSVNEWLYNFLYINLLCVLFC